MAYPTAKKGISRTMPPALHMCVCVWECVGVCESVWVCVWECVGVCVWVCGCMFKRCGKENHASCVTRVCVCVCERERERVKGVEKTSCLLLDVYVCWRCDKGDQQKFMHPVSHVCVHTYMWVYTYTKKHTYVYEHERTYIHTRTKKCSHMYQHKRVHTYTWTQIYTGVRIWTCQHTIMQIDTHRCKNTRAHTHKHTKKYTRVNKHMRAYTYMYDQIQTCTRKITHTHHTNKRTMCTEISVHRVINVLRNTQKNQHVHMYVCVENPCFEDNKICVYLSTPCECQKSLSTSQGVETCILRGIYYLKGY